jgi:hypothetical protein
VTERDAAFFQVVGGNFNGDPIADGNTDEMLAHLAGNMRQYLVSVVQFNPLHGGRQHLLHNAFRLDYNLFSHTRSFKNSEASMLHG